MLSNSFAGVMDTSIKFAATKDVGNAGVFPFPLML